MRYIYIMAREDGGCFEVKEQGGNQGERPHRVAELLRVVSQATAELAAEFDRSGDGGVERMRGGVRRRRQRSIAVPQHVTDLDVAAARRALRRAGL
jgi:hypothetical protein